MPLDINEALSDLPAALALIQKVQAGVSSLPPKASRTAADYAALIVAVVPDLAKLVDQVEAQVKS